MIYKTVSREWYRSGHSAFFADIPGHFFTVSEGGYQTPFGQFNLALLNDRQSGMGKAGNQKEIFIEVNFELNPIVCPYILPDCLFRSLFNRNGKTHSLIIVFTNIYRLFGCEYSK